MKIPALAALFAIACISMAQAAVKEENFVLDTTGDLIALCGVQADDPNAVAAIHMCHGYLTGLVHFHEMIGRALEGQLYCLAIEDRPTRDQAVAMLVEWSRAHPEHDSKEAIDGVMQWAADTWPCE